MSAGSKQIMSLRLRTLLRERRDFSTAQTWPRDQIWKGMKTALTQEPQTPRKHAWTWIIFIKKGDELKFPSGVILGRGFI